MYILMRDKMEVAPFCCLYFLNLEPLDPVSSGIFSLVFEALFVGRIPLAYGFAQRVALSV